ncbi:toll/interleukin-1 receptor domain-containing protein [Methylobacterium sp. 1030]|uniref:toll/interleukin-1 receptor domain-containing protein n=1 Tax=Methylobacterium sp. 1030 TaxID=3156404 RepID=UPI0033997B24
MITAARYAVAILGPGAATHGPRLKRAIKKRLRELGENVLDHVDFPRRRDVADLGTKMPAVAVYFGGSDVPSDDDDVVKVLLARATVVIPVVQDLSVYGSQVPAELGRINGVAWDLSDPPDGLCNLVLENLGLLRKSRRLFISYRRTDSSAAALQLRHALEARGYDVFLDTHSVPKGDDFQEVLWHRLSDSDVVVLLDTAGFVESRWTKEELAQASAMTIGIVQVIWPGHEELPDIALSERLRLDPSNFAGETQDELVPAMVEAIAERVEALRARSLAARHDNLVREFCDAAERVLVAAVVQPERFITATLKSGDKVAAIPAVGVLDASRYHEATKRFHDDRDYAAIFLLYDGRGLRPAWGEFLRWLDEHLPVKAVRITQAEERLVEQ